MENWQLRAPEPRLVRPVRVDPTGQNGPTKRQAAGPFWRRAVPGYFVPASADRSVPEQGILEQSFRITPGGAVTGWAALRMHGAGYLDGRDSVGALPVPLVALPGTNLRSGPDAVVHRERLLPEEVTMVLGVPVTTPVRATFDAVRRCEDLRTAVVTLDMTLAAGVVDLPALSRYLLSKRRWPGLSLVQRAIALADPRSMSAQESRLRLIWVLDAHLPRPRSNWPVADRDGRLVGRPDLLSTELSVIGEFDGAEHRSRERQREDLRRDDQFRAVGLEPFRVVGADLKNTDLVVRRMREAIKRARNLPQSFLVKANPRPV